MDQHQPDKHGLPRLEAPTPINPIRVRQDRSSRNTPDAVLDALVGPFPARGTKRPPLPLYHQVLLLLLLLLWPAINRAGAWRNNPSAHRATTLSRQPPFLKQATWKPKEQSQNRHPVIGSIVFFSSADPS